MYDIHVVDKMAGSVRCGKQQVFYLTANKATSLPPTLSHGFGFGGQLDSLSPKNADHPTSKDSESIDWLGIVLSLKLEFHIQEVWPRLEHIITYHRLIIYPGPLLSYLIIEDYVASQNSGLS